jgi:cupin 2 domain-containing protein
MKNIYDFNLPDLDSENFYTLLKHKNITVKTIVSNTLKTPQTFKQDIDEYVIVISGCAKIKMDGMTHKLKKGDTLFIPANKEHILLKTKQVVVWLAIYMA